MTTIVDMGKSTTEVQVRNTLSDEQRTMLAELCRQASIPRKHEATALSWCERVYREGCNDVPEPTGRIKTPEQVLISIDAYAPRLFHNAVDMLSDQGKTRRKQAAVAIKKVLRRLEFN